MLLPFIGFVEFVYSFSGSDSYVRFSKLSHVPSCLSTHPSHTTPRYQPTSTGYVAASILTGGFIVSFPEFFHYAK